MSSRSCGLPSGKIASGGMNTPQGVDSFAPGGCPGLRPSDILIY
jgi:hypothetical protein